MSLRSLFGGIVAEAPVSYTSKWRTPLSFGAGRDSMTRGAQLAQYESVGTLFGIVSKLAMTTSLVDWKLWRPATSGLEEDRTEVTRHAALTVWNKPNPFFGRQEFVETFQQHIDLTGEAWWVIDKAGTLPLEIWPVRPDRMAPVEDAKEFIAGYVYTSPDGEKVPLRRDQVILIRWPSPVNIFRGSSPLPALAADLANETSQSSWSAAFYRNSASPGGVIQVDRRLQEEEFDELVDRWNRSHRGISNAGRVAVLEEAKFIPMAYTQRDMQYVETRGFTKQSLLDAYGFPKFGLGDVDDVNRATATASLALIAQTLTVPRLERIKYALNGEFLPMFGAAAGALEFDYENPVPPDAETDNATLTAKTTAVVALVGAGFDVDEACDAVDLPRMKFEKPEPPPVLAPPAPGKQKNPELEPAK